MSGTYVIKHGDVYRVERSQVPGLAHMSDVHVCDGSEMMAVAYDSSDGTLHKAGRAEGVEEWAAKTRKKFADGGFEDLGSDLVVVSFPPVEETIAELNACIECSGRVLRFTEALEEIGRRRPDLFERPVYPK